MKRPNFISKRNISFKERDDGKLMKWGLWVRERETCEVFIGKLWTNNAHACYSSFINFFSS